MPYSRDRFESMQHHALPPEFIMQSCLSFCFNRWSQHFFVEDIGLFVVTFSSLPTIQALLLFEFQHSLVPTSAFNCASQ